MMKTTEPDCARRQRQLVFVSEFIHAIQHISAKDNIVAEALSRDIMLHPLELTLPNWLRTIAHCTDPEIRLLAEGDTDLDIQEIEYSPGITLLCNNSLAKFRLLVPFYSKRNSFDLIHNLSHPSIRNTKHLMSQGLKAQIGKWAKECESCQAAKVTRHTKASLQIFAVPARKF